MISCVTALPFGKTNNQRANGASSSSSLAQLATKGQPQGQAVKTNSISPVFTSRQPLSPPPRQQQQVQQQEQEPESDSPSQQIQQQQEIDPSGAAQNSAPALALPARASPSAVANEEAEPRPEPYSFAYEFESADSRTSGSSQRAEQQDARGVVTGKLTD